jgi:pheromone a factor receptor
MQVNHVSCHFTTINLTTITALVVRTFITQHKELNEALTNESSKVTYSRFYRAFALASVDTLFTIPLSIVVLYINAVITGPVIRWPGWTKVHNGYFSPTVYYGPAAYWRNPLIYRLAPHGVGWVRFSIAWHQWIHAFCAFIFIAIYGTTAEVMHYYTNLFKRVAKVFGWKETQNGQIKNGIAQPSTILFESVAPARAGTTFETPSMMQSSIS